MPQPKRKQDGPTIKVKGHDYNVNKDFSWRELLTVEELAGMPLGRDDSLESMAVGAAFIFVILKRENPELTWSEFLDQRLGDIDTPGESTANGNGHAARPTKPAKTAGSSRSA